MKTRTLFSSYLRVVFVASLLLGASRMGAAGEQEVATAAVEKLDGNGVFRARHESFLARGHAGPIDLLFIGDSIVAGWARVPHIWEQYYGRYRAANFGVSGDRTQHVIWRIENGELDGLAPDVTVLLLATNNSDSHSAPEIVAALKKIVGLIREKMPDTQLLLLAIFPRGARKDLTGVISPRSEERAARRMETINAVNAQLAELDDARHVRFLDINAVFLGQDGRIPFSIMPDQLHLSAAGYQLWADAMEPTLRDLFESAGLGKKENNDEK